MVRVRVCSDEGLTLETSAFQNSLQRLIYPYQLHVDNQLSKHLKRLSRFVHVRKVALILFYCFFQIRRLQSVIILQYINTHTTCNPPLCSDEGLAIETSAFKIRYGR